MQHLPLACFLSLIRPPGITFEDSYLQILPVDKAKCPFVRDHSDITIRLYTRHNPVVYQELHIDDDESLFASHMDFHDPTVIYFTAFLEQPDDGSGLSVREAYMLRGDTNFIIFDLSRLEAGPWYFTAAENTWYIGNFAAKLIDYLVSRGMDLKKTHLVGHSLGAQSAGVAGSVIKSGRIARITGLDPAFPLFDKLPLSQRLDPSDAEFVDVIHTDAGIFGFNRPTGHVDFYPNGGISPQPGCELEVVLHEQRLLNNCDEAFAPHGYYIFYLDTQRQNTLEQNIVQFFRHIDNLRKTNVNSKRSDAQIANNISSAKKEQTTDNSHDLKQLTIENKENKRSKNKKETTNMKTRFEKESHNILKQLNNTEVQLLVEIQDKSPYKRDKRISVVDKKYHNTASTLLNINNRHIVQEIKRQHKVDDNKTAKTDPTTKLYKQKYDSDIHIVDTDNNLKAIEKLYETVEENSASKSSKLTQLNKQKLNDNKTQFIDNTTDIEKSYETVKEFATLLKKQNKINNTHIVDADKTDIEGSLKTVEKLNTIANDSMQVSLHFVTNKEVHKRQKRFISWFRNNNSNNNNEESFLLKMLEFLVKNRKNVIPVVTVMREINTLVKSANGELNHSSKERNNYIGTPPQFIPITYDLEIGNESGAVAFVKRLLGLGVRGGKLTVSGNGK